MTLAFYKVDNSKGYDRHTFDFMSKKEIKKALEPLLYTDEVRFYKLDEDGVNRFTEDYNDEELDGGWWCLSL